MPIDQTAIGVVAAQMMEELAAAYGDEATITNVFLLATVDFGPGDRTHYRASPGTPTYVGIGQLRVILDRLRKQAGEAD